MQKNVLDYFENSAKNFADKTAIIEENSQICFKDLRTKSRALSLALQNIGIKRREIVGVFLPKSINSIISFFACIYNGCVYVPLDAKSPLSRIKSICENLDLKNIITDENGAKFLDSLDANFILIDKCNLNDDSDFIEQNYKNSIDTDPLYIINTSGSTGTPKGVTISHSCVIDYMSWVIDEYKLDDKLTIGNQVPFHFDVSVSDIFLMAFKAATLVIIPENLFAFPLKLAWYINEKNINFIFWVPSALTPFSKLEILDDYNLKLKFVIIVGEPMAAKHLNYIRKHARDAKFANLYGPTETTIISTYFNIDKELDINKSIPIGKPCKNTEILVLDENNCLIAENNVDKIGELCIKGKSLSLGYYNNPEKTAEVFVQNPFNKAYNEKIYRTGDLVYYDENGDLIFCGRKDSQIKHNGYRIELGEIETVILGLSQIDEACVLYDGEIVLFYVSKEQLDKKDFIIKFSDRLPKYMWPSKFIKLDQMPLNINGKINRIKLKELISKPSV